MAMYNPTTDDDDVSESTASDGPTSSLSLNANMPISLFPIDVVIPAVAKDFGASG